MLIFVSDLHLVDSPGRATLNAKGFLRELETCIAQCPPEDTPTLILLGDIFELLKSSQWLSSSVRPWHPVSQELTNLTKSILQSIFEQNNLFFEGLTRLHKNKNLQLFFTPGNHDGLLAADGGTAARAFLRSLLPLQGTNDESFASVFQSAKYGVYAEHGHEFDSFNRRDKSNPYLVPGDVVVIELVTRLPYEVARHFGGADPMSSQFDEALGFLHDLDDVLPQDAQGLLSWIQHCLDAKPDSQRRLLEKAVLHGLKDCLYHVARASSGTVITTLLDALRMVIKGGMRAVEALAKLEPDRSDELMRVTASVRNMAQTQMREEQDTFLFVAGHTHLSMHHPIAVGQGRTITYINSGTWRRVLRYVLSPDKTSTFAGYYEATMLCVHRRQGNHPPTYEFRSQIYGA